VFEYLFPSLLMTLVFTTAGRLFIYRGSMFDPVIAPGFGALSAGDLLFIGAVLVGLVANFVHRRWGQREARAVMYGSLAFMFLVVSLFVRPQS
jgi:uncharacterized PurR-regulated membrane protein YhhQ (DUF165 family)